MEKLAEFLTLTVNPFNGFNGMGLGSAGLRPSEAAACRGRVRDNGPGAPECIASVTFGKIKQRDHVS